MRLGVVVVAAGSGTRLESDVPKALVPLAGRALVTHTLDGIADAGLPPPVVVHTPGLAEAFAAELGHHEVAGLVAGGATRTESVRAGIARLDTDVELVVVHDAARPLTPTAVFRATVAAVTGDVLAAAPALQVADTLKRVEGDAVGATVDRRGLVAVQTPQVFRRRVIDAALDLGDDATDELALVERLLDASAVRGRIVVVPGSPFGHKVTYAEDLALLTALVGGGTAAERGGGHAVTPTGEHG